MAVTLKMIEEKEFSIVSNGFNPEEVDNFLDEIWEEIDRLLKENNELQQKLAAAVAAPAPVAPVVPLQKPVEAAPVNDDAVNDLKEILAMAQQVKRDTIAKAQADAAELLAIAEQEANEKLGNLTEEKTRLEGQVAGLRQAAADYRAKFEALLAAQQDAIDKATDLF